MEKLVANKPDIIVTDQVNKKCQIIDMAVQTDRHTSVKAVEKLPKWKDLEIEVARMWKIKIEMILVVVFWA